MRVLGITLALVLITCAGGAAQPVSPLVADWDRYFTVQPHAAAGGPSVTVANASGWGASRIQLLVEALDAAGQPVSQRVMWLGVDLPAGTRADFSTPAPAAAAYRVRVFAFDLDVTSGPR